MKTLKEKLGIILIVLGVVSIIFGILALALGPKANFEDGEFNYIPSYEEYKVDNPNSSKIQYELGYRAIYQEDLDDLDLNANLVPLGYFILTVLSVLLGLLGIGNEKKIKLWHLVAYTIFFMGMLFFPIKELMIYLLN